MKNRIIFTVLIASLLLTSIAYAGFSTQIPLQGRLSDSNNIPMGGTHSLSFKIFDVASGGTPLFTETISGVVVTNGLFSVVLGESQSNPLNIAFDKDYYVEITVDSEVLSPRQRLLPSP